MIKYKEAEFEYCNICIYLQKYFYLLKAQLVVTKQPVWNNSDRHKLCVCVYVCV